MKLVSAADYFRDLHQRCASTEMAVQTIRRENRVARFIEAHSVIILLLLLPVASVPAVLLGAIVGVPPGSVWADLLMLPGAFIAIIAVVFAEQKANRSFLVERALLHTAVVDELPHDARYLLYLRSFEGERRNVSWPEFAPQQLKVFENSSHALRRAVHEASKTIRVIEASNLEDERRVRQVDGDVIETCLYELPDWPQRIEKLAQNAAVVLMQVDVLTDGVKLELAMARQWTTRTLILAENGTAERLSPLLTKSPHLQWGFYERGELRPFFGAGNVSYHHPPVINVNLLTDGGSRRIALDPSWLTSWVGAG